jgi:hypothetical protein
LELSIIKESRRKERQNKSRFFEDGTKSHALFLAPFNLYLIILYPFQEDLKSVKIARPAERFFAPKNTGKPAISFKAAQSIAT